MFGRLFTAVAAVVGAFIAGSAAQAAIFTFSFYNQTYSMPGVENDIYAGMGELFATGNDASGYSVYWATGTTFIPGCDFCSEQEIGGAAGLGDFAPRITLTGAGYVVDGITLLSGPWGGGFSFANNGDGSDEDAPTYYMGAPEIFAPNGNFWLTLASDETPVLANPGVPEVATWAMMLMGFGAVGGAIRRQRGAALA